MMAWLFVLLGGFTWRASHGEFPTGNSCELHFDGVRKDLLRFSVLSWRCLTGRLCFDRLLLIGGVRCGGRRWSST
jgi:hypothetical protein